MPTHWQDDIYDDEWDEWDEWWNDEDYNPYGCNNHLFPDDYYEESDYKPSLWQRILNLPYQVRWHIVDFWQYTLGMKKCSICGRRRRQGCTDDCIPF